MPVKGNFESVVNHLGEIVKRSHRLAGLEPIAKDRTVARYAQAVRRAGGLTGTQAELLGELSKLRNRLQHSSPDVQADEVWARAHELLDVLPRMSRHLTSWLAERGHRVVGPTP